MKKQPQKKTQSPSLPQKETTVAANNGKENQTPFYRQDWFWGMAQFALILVSLIIIINQLTLQRNTHLITTLAILDERWSSNQMLQARNTFCNNWLNGETPPNSSGETIAEFFEQVGIYVKLQAIPENFVWETYSWYIENYHFLLNPSLDIVRSDDPTLYSEFENVFIMSQRISAENGAPTEISDEELRAFCEREIEIISLALEIHNK